MQVISPKKEVLALTLFALNPLVIIESIVSGHNDIAMMFLVMLSILFLVQKKYVLAFVLLFLSIGVKFATGLLLPLFIVIYLFQKRQVAIQWPMIFLTFIVTMILALFAATLRSTFQPWYLMYLLPIAALIPDEKYIIFPIFIISIMGLLNYIPYLYVGNWDSPIPTVLLTLNILGGLIAFVTFIWFYHHREIRKAI